jgi:hypothetical protein
LNTVIGFVIIIQQRSEVCYCSFSCERRVEHSSKSCSAKRSRKGSGSQRRDSLPATVVTRVTANVSYSKTSNRLQFSGTRS